MLSLNHRFPFNWKCPFGYLVAVILQWISFTYICLVMMIMIAVGIGAFVFMTAFTKDIQCILHAIDENSRFKRKRRLISLQFVEFIDLYWDVKQLSKYTFEAVEWLKSSVLYSTVTLILGRLTVSRNYINQRS